jgi:hypothetical protein
MRLVVNRRGIKKFPRHFYSYLFVGCIITEQNKRGFTHNHGIATAGVRGADYNSP